MPNEGYSERLQEGRKLISGKELYNRLHTCTISCNGYGYGYWFCLISTFPISDAISCEERGETDADLVVALYTMGKTELLKAVASAHHVIDLNRRREIANTVKMANERITSILNR